MGERIITLHPVATVKLDLEARGFVERVPGPSPQVLRLAGRP